MGTKVIVGLIVLAIGIVLGLTIPKFLSPSLSPYLPSALHDQVEAVEGQVVRKAREEGRLLLTVSTPRGALLATFTKQISEIDLLVEEGDSIRLGLSHYEPFVKDPQLKSVMKPDMMGEQVDLSQDTPELPSSLENQFEDSQDFSSPTSP